MLQVVFHHLSSALDLFLPIALRTLKTLIMELPFAVLAYLVLVVILRRVLLGYILNMVDVLLLVLLDWFGGVIVLIDHCVVLQLCFLLRRLLYAVGIDSIIITAPGLGLT